MPDLTLVRGTKPPPIARLVGDYLAACRARGLSPRTIKSGYGYPLLHVFLPFCAEQEITEVAEVDNRTLNRLSAKLMDSGGRSQRPIGAHTIHAYMRAINQFLAWAAGEGEAVTAKAQLPRLPKKLIDVLTRDELQAMEDAAQTDRDRLLVRVLADTGIRVGELVGLRISDLDVIGRNYFLRIRGKGARERFVPIPARIYRRLEHYATKQRPKGTRTDRLFLNSRRGLNGEYEALTESGVGQLLPVLAEQAGIQKRVYPHLLRHSFATWALTRGMNPMSLAKIMGHSSLIMIQQVYAHLTPADSYDALMKILTEDK